MKKVFKHLVGYGLGTLLLKAAGFLLIPIYLRIFSPAEYGVIDLTMVFIGLASVFATAGLSQLFHMQFIHLSEHERNRLLYPLMVTYCLWGTVITIASAISLWVLPLFSVIPTMVRVLALILLFLSFFEQLFYTRLRLEQQVKKLVTIQVGVGILSLLLNIILVIVLRLGVVAIFISSTIAIVVVLFIASKSYTTWLRDSFRAPVTSSEIGGYLKTSLLLMGGQLGVLLQAQIDRWLIVTFLGISFTGIYAVAGRVAAAFNVVVVGTVMSAVNPIFLEKLKERERETVKKIQWVSYGIITGGLLITLAVYYLLEPLFIMIVTETFADAFVPMCILLFSQWIFLAIIVRNIYVVYRKNVVVMSIGVWVGAIINISVGLAVIQEWGLFGAAVSTLLGNSLWYLVIEIVSLHYSRKMHHE